MQCFLRYNAIAHFVHACSVALAMSNSVTLWTTACQAPLSLGFSRQEYRSGLPFPSSGDRPDPGIKPMSPELQADSLLLSHQGSPHGTGKALSKWKLYLLFNQILIEINLFLVFKFDV